MFKKIWNPNKEILAKLKVLFMVSIPLSLLLSLVLNQFFPRYSWHLLGVFWVIGLIMARIIASIRFSVIEGSKLENQNHSFLKKLSGTKRIRFIKTVIGIGIFLVVTITGLLYLANLIIPIEKILILFIAVIVFGIYISSMRRFYLNLAKNDQELL